MFFDFDKDPNSTANTAATNAEALAGTETAKYVSPAALRYAVDAITNPRATQGALAFDGAASSRVYSTLTNQNIGTDPFSVVFKVEVPSSNPSGARPLGCLSSSSTTSGVATALTVFVNTSGGLDIYLFGATTSDFNRAVVSGIVSAWGGKTVIVCVSRATSGNLAVYVNGAVQSPTYSTGGTAPTWQGSVTSTYFGVGYDSASQVFVGKIYSASLYNLALSQADVTEIQELGGGVPFRYQFGSQVGLLTGNDSTFDGSLTSTVNINNSVGGGQLTMTAGGVTGWYSGTKIALRKVYAVTVDIASNSGTVAVGTNTGSAYGITTTGTGAFSGTFTADVTNFLLSSVGGTAVINSATLKQLGAVAHYNAGNGGSGFELRDESTNKLHATITSTGVSWTQRYPWMFDRVLADGTNTRNIQGAVAFDGTASGRCVATLTNQPIGTDDFSVVVKFSITAELATAQDTIWQIGSTSNSIAPPASIRCFVDGGSLSVEFSNGSSLRSLNVPSFLANYAGKTVVFVFTRAGAVGKIYINAVDTNATYGGSASFAETITSTYLILGSPATNYTLVGKIYAASLYNLALSPAEVAEIQELGGSEVPERYKFGSQATITGNPIVNGIAGNNPYGTFSGASSTGFSAADTSGFHAASIGAAISAVIGTKVRVKATLTLNSGGAPTVGLFTPGVSGMSTGDTALSAGANSIELTATSLNANARISFYRTGATDFVLTGVETQRLGAVVHFVPGLDGIGYQLHDQSTNKLDAVIATAGVTWTKPARRGYVRGTLTWSGTHEAKSLLVQRAFPPGAIIDKITTKATAASSGSGMTLGPSNNAARWVAAVTYSTSKKVHTIANGGQPAGSVDDVNEHDLLIDPDTAAYSGSIQVNASYEVTEGTP